MGVVIRGVILDDSVLLARQRDDDLHANGSLQSGAESLLRKLRHSKFRTVSSLSLLILNYAIPCALYC